MKTSKLILFSYIGILALTFLGFVIYLTTVDQESRSTVESKYQQISEQLPFFNCISVDRISLNITGSDKSEISVYVERDKEVPDIAYRCSNDTLFVDYTGKYGYVNLQLQNTPTLNVISKGGVVHMKEIEVDTLNYTGLDESELRGFNGCKVSVVTVDLLNSRFFAFNGSMGRFQLNAAKSRVNVKCDLAEVAGEISNNSEVRINNAESLSLRKDKSSRFFCYP